MGLGVQGLGNVSRGYLTGDMEHSPNITPYHP